MVLKIFLTGWIILVVAIALNFIAVKLGVDTWFSYINEIGKVGIVKAFSNSTIISKLFLFIIYPFILGLTAYLVLKIIK